MLGLLGAFVPINKAPARPRRLSVVVGTNAPRSPSITPNSMVHPIP